MRILHLSTNDNRGGAATAAYRINGALNSLGVNSQMLVQNKYSDDPDVETTVTTTYKTITREFRFLYDKLPLKLFYRDRADTPFQVGKTGIDISGHEAVRESDILHLHWITHGFLSVGSLRKLAELDKPVVWTLHDQWPFTGGCIYSGDCERYTDNCGRCPALNSDRGKDLSTKMWKRKQRAYRNLELTVVSPGSWLGKRAKCSSLLGKFDLEVIPNPIDTQVFKPAEQETARDILNLPRDKRLVLFGADVPEAKLKGFSYVKKALKLLATDLQKPEEEIEIVIFGTSHSEEMENNPFPTNFTGYLNDTYSLTLCYSAADIFVGPSLQEAFGQTFLESMACRTPAVAFDYAGPREIIDHKRDGFLAQYRSAQSLAEGIQWTLKDEERLRKLGKKARDKAVSEYGFDTVGEQYRQLYQNVLG